MFNILVDKFSVSIIAGQFNVSDWPVVLNYADEAGDVGEAYDMHTAVNNLISRCQSQ